jgi:hypothetical protein
VTAVDNGRRQRYSDRLPDFAALRRALDQLGPVGPLRPCSACGASCVQELCPVCIRLAYPGS